VKNEEIALRLDRLASQVAGLDKRLAGIEVLARRVVGPAPKQMAAEKVQPPWKMTPAHVEALAADLYSAVKKEPHEALNFQPAAESFYLTAHARNVSKLAMFLADKHGLSEASTRTVGICGLLHDAGMDSLPRDLLSANRPLTQQEYQQVRMHPTRGAEYVRRHYDFGSLVSSVVPMVVEQHHERSDGTGYPRGLAGDGIHEFARILAIADSYEALTTPRAFRRPKHPTEAMRTLLLQGYPSPDSGMYDHAILKTFLWSASLYPIGCKVNLSDGRRAEVISATADPKRPVVKLLGQKHTAEAVDLTQHQDTAITDQQNAAAKD